MSPLKNAKHNVQNQTEINPKLDKVEPIPQSETLDEFSKRSTPPNLIPQAIQNAVLRLIRDPRNSPNAALKSTHDPRQTDHDALGIGTRSNTKPEKF